MGFVLNLTNYFAHQDGLELVFCDSERVLETIGPILSGSRGAELAESVRKGQILQGSGIVVATEPINFRQMCLAVIQETGGMRALVGSWEFWLLFILIPLILVGVLFRIRHLFSHTLVWPVEHLASRLDRMKENKKAGEYPETEGTKVRELLDCRVPILAIQTFVENAVKHANRPGQILSVEVAVKELEREDGLYISIRISDNGKCLRQRRERFRRREREFRGGRRTGWRRRGSRRRRRIRRRSGFRRSCGRGGSVPVAGGLHHVSRAQ